MTSSGPDEPDTSGAVAVRRAVAAGAAVWVVLSLLFGLALAPGGGRAVFAGVSWALAAGLFVAAGWACLTLVLDLARGRSPGRGRVGWSIALGVGALLMPVFAAAATTVS